MIKVIIPMVALLLVVFLKKLPGIVSGLQESRGAVSARIISESYFRFFMNYMETGRERMIRLSLRELPCLKICL